MTFQLQIDGTAAIVGIKMPRKVQAVKQLLASADALGYTATRKPVKLDKQWIKWAKDIRRRR